MASRHAPILHALFLIDADGTGTCEPLPVEGESCTQINRGQCQLGFVCNRDLQVCQKPARLGDVCGAPEECASAKCSDGVCVTGATCLEEF